MTPAAGAETTVLLVKVTKMRHHSSSQLLSDGIYALHVLPKRVSTDGCSCTMAVEVRSPLILYVSSKSLSYFNTLQQSAAMIDVHDNRWR